jgi:DNA repair protein RadC
LWGTDALAIREYMRVYEASISYTLVQLGNDTKVNSPQAVTAYLQSAFATHPTQESFWVILLDRKNRAIGRVLISLGTLTSCLVHPREVFKPAILASASAIIVAHNHPSGDPAPSQADLQVTRQLKAAAVTLDIDLLDHVIVGDAESDPKGHGQYSFREAGLL